MAENNDDVPYQMGNMLSFWEKHSNVRKDVSKKPDAPPKPKIDRNSYRSSKTAEGSSATPGITSDLKKLTLQSTTEQTSSSSNTRRYNAKEGTEIRVHADKSQKLTLQEDTISSYTKEARTFVPPLSKGVRTMMNTQLPHKVHSCWSSKEKGAVWVGGSECDNISLVKNKGHDVKTLRLDIKGSPIILSGLNIKGNEYAITVANQEEQSVAMFLIMISTDFSAVTSKRKVDSNGPFVVYEHSDDEVGTFNMGADKVDNRIKIYDRHTMEKKYVIHLKDVGKESIMASGVCRTRTNEYLTSDIKHNVIYRHNEDGDFIGTLGTSAAEALKNKPGELYRPAGVFEDVEGAILVPCQDGVIHRSQNGKWDIVSNINSGQHGVCFVDNMMYTVYGNDFTIHKIKQ